MTMYILLVYIEAIYYLLPYSNHLKQIAPQILRLSEKYDLEDQNGSLYMDSSPC